MHPQLSGLKHSLLQLPGVLAGPSSYSHLSFELPPFLTGFVWMDTLHFWGQPAVNDCLIHGCKGSFLVPQFGTLLKGHPGFRAPCRVSWSVCCDSITAHLLLPSLASFPSLPGVDLRVLPGRQDACRSPSQSLFSRRTWPVTLSFQEKAKERGRDTEITNCEMTPLPLFFFSTCLLHLVSQLIFKSQAYILHRILGLDVKKKHWLFFNEQ